MSANNKLNLLMTPSPGLEPAPQWWGVEGGAGGGGEFPRHCVIPVPNSRHPSRGDGAGMSQYFIFRVLILTDSIVVCFSVAL